MAGTRSYDFSKRTYWRNGAKYLSFNAGFAGMGKSGSPNKWIVSFAVSNNPLRTFIGNTLEFNESSTLIFLSKKLTLELFF